jgi:hypothetical protein
MSMLVKFANGEEEQYDADSACLQDWGRLFVLYKLKGGKSKSVNTFPAGQVVWAQSSNGDIVLGRGQVKSK